MTSTTAQSRGELIVGLVGATGSGLRSVDASLREALTPAGYGCHTIRVVHLLRSFRRWKKLPTGPEEERLARAMDAGNEFRNLTGRGDALAVWALSGVRDLRAQETGTHTAPVPNRAYVLRSFKHPEEIETLRRVYGKRFILIGAYSPRAARVTNLAKTIARSHHSSQLDHYRSHAEQLINRDQSEEGQALGQHLRDAFPLADVFVDGSDGRKMKEGIQRYVDLVFGAPFLTPLRDEYGMFHAHAAALRSSQMGRQVGATILSSEGDVVAVGTNEVPKAGGGAYWPDDPGDARDHVLGFDSTDRMKREMLAEVLERLRAAGWLKRDLRRKSANELLELVLAGEKPIMKNVQMMNVLEYGRAVHAEMAAIVDAARRGMSVRDCVMYVTAFPCHNCARHIVAAGIRRVVYIEPYPKSLAPLLHLDAIVSDDASGGSKRVSFDPFVGVAPHRYTDMFTMSQRKTADGVACVWDPATSLPRIGEDDRTYIVRESKAIGELKDTLAGISLR